MRRISTFRADGYNDLFSLMDAMFNDTGFPDLLEQPRHNKLISTGDWPPANVIVNTETKELTIEVGLVGVTEDQINLGFDGDNLKLVVHTLPVEREPISKLDAPLRYLQRGLRRIGSVECSWKIDPRFYDRDNVEVKLVNGLLTIKMQPREDVKPKKIDLFGSYKPIDSTCKLMDASTKEAE